MSFDSLGLSKPILKAVSEKGYTEPSPIQVKAIPPILENRDMIYKQAKQKTPARWTGETRDWKSTKIVVLNKTTRPTKKVA